MMMQKLTPAAPLSVVEGPSRSERVLVTGGAGFIGSHVARRLLERGCAVRALDCLDPQVHGPSRTRPAYLESDVELVVGDVRDRAAVDRALAGCDAVVHLAARVGVGQSMYELAEYSSVNTLGTGVLLEALIEHPVRKLLVASSMSVYGEGLYRTAAGEVRETVGRTRHQLEADAWEPLDADGAALMPSPTPEWKRPAISSVYALGKYDQEQMCLLFGETYGIPTVALRFFNVYGRDQALSNPYTGVLAIFAARLLGGRAPIIFEDGRQRRDFVSVTDVARACALALEREGADGRAINVASGENVSVLDVARTLGRLLDREAILPALPGQYRVGDIRHCFADPALAAETLGYRAEIRLAEGMAELAGWLEGQAAEDRVESATAELTARGLTL